MSTADAITRLNAALEGRYRIERQLGEGGMATVYLADDLRHERKVALKVLKPELAAVVGAERFLAEIKTTANLQHPHILPLFDSGEADSFLFYVMPYVEGESLRERLDREHQLPVDEAVQIAKNVAEGLDYAHRQGVIHRDIKPANILLQDGKPVVSDFGIALAVGAAGGGRLTETGLSLGTPHYMSPEQATGDLSIGAATDIYALGCVLYEMLVGEPPYTGSTPQAVLGKIVTGDADPVTKHRSSVPANVDGAIRKALEKVPADRFSGASNFAAALSDAHFRHARDARTRVREVGPWRRIALGSVALSVVLSVGLAWSLRRPTDERPARRYVVSLPSDFARQFVHRGFAVSPDGRTVVFADRVGRLYRQEPGELDAHPIPGTASAWYPIFSPDGQWVAYFDQSDATLRKTRLDGSDAQRIADVTGTLRSAGWRDDGTIVLHTSARAGLWSVSDSGGELEQIAVGEELAWLDLLPGGRALVAAAGNADGQDEVLLVSLDTGERRPLFAGGTPRFVPPNYLLFERQGSLMAVQFDPAGLSVLGEPRVIVDGLAVDAGNKFAHFAAAGRLLFYEESSSLNEVPLWVGRDGTEEVLDPLLMDRLTNPAVSPDGRRIAFVLSPIGASLGIWIYDLDQRTLSRLSAGVEPFWSPDGREVGFSNNRESGRRFFYDLYSRPADLSAERRVLVSDPDDGERVARWTPNGRWIVYQRGTNETTGRVDLWYAAPSPDSTPHVIVDTPAREGDPTISPDGHWVAYVSDDSGSNEVYVRPFPGPGGRYAVSNAGGVSPVWAHNGRELLYLAGPPTARTLTVAAVRTEGTFSVESRTALFAWPYQVTEFDVSLDDQRIVTLGVPRGATARPGRYVVVENFDAELRRVTQN